MITVKSIAISQVGKVREHNEDAVSAADEHGLWIVADGMGGHACGEVASQLAVDVVVKAMAHSTDLNSAIKKAHESILQQSKSQPEQQGMGTTLVAAQSLKAGFKIAWVGDSRAYLYNGTLQQITTDHTFVQDMVYREVLTAEEAINHPQGNLINRSLGMTEGRFNVDAIKIKPASSGYLLLCSDGVSDYVSHQHLQTVFEQAHTLNEAAVAIKEVVLETEAADNFSFVIISYNPGKLAKWRNKFFK